MGDARRRKVREKKKGGNKRRPRQKTINLNTHSIGTGPGRLLISGLENERISVEKVARGKVRAGWVVERRTLTTFGASQRKGLQGREDGGARFAFGREGDAPHARSRAAENERMARTKKEAGQSRC